jgi:hypothetical protein
MYCFKIHWSVRDVLCNFQTRGRKPGQSSNSRRDDSGEETDDSGVPGARRSETSGDKSTGGSIDDDGGLYFSNVRNIHLENKPMAFPEISTEFDFPNLCFGLNAFIIILIHQDEQESVDVLSIA